MQVILIQDVNHLGSVNEVVKVKNGYGRNFLIPQKYAVEATPSSLKMLDEKMKVMKKKEEKMLAEINQVITKLAETKIILQTKVGNTGRIFGSITTVMLAREIQKQCGYPIERKKISIPEHIKEIGVYKAEINFGKDTKASVDFEIVAESE